MPAPPPPGQKPPVPTSRNARLFLALIPPATVQAALAQHCAQWHWNAGATRYAPDDWHITLYFLGMVERQDVDALGQGLDVAFSPFTLRLGQPQHWPQGLAVLCPETVPAALTHLRTRLGRALQQLGHAPDARPYRPHITLARHAQEALTPPQKACFEWPVTGYALVESTGQTPQRYRVLRHYPLAS